MPVSFAALRQTRPLAECELAACRLERQLGSGDSSIARAGLEAFDALYRQLSPEQRASLPRSEAVKQFLQWRELPRGQRMSPVDVRVQDKPRSQALLVGVDNATREAFLAHGSDKRAWLYRAARMLTVADQDTLDKPAVRGRLTSLARRCERLGEPELAQALTLAAQGKPAKANKLLSSRRAQLSSGPRDNRFGKVTAERLGDVVRVNGADISAKDWARIEQVRDRTLRLYERALSRQSLAGKPIDNLEQLRSFLMLGKSESERIGLFADKRGLLEARGPLVEKLTALKASGKKIILYLEGHDAAGKTSSAQALLSAMKEAGYEIATRAFKGPSEEERKQHWLDRFKKSVEENPGVTVWDRGFAGNWAYGPSGDTELAELEDFERALPLDTVLVKVNLRAEPERQAATFGKRWARALIAEELLENPQASPGLRSILDTTLSPNDLPAYANFAEIDSRFNAFVDKNNTVVPWVRIDTTSRAVARAQMMRLFG